MDKKKINKQKAGKTTTSSDVDQFVKETELQNKILEKIIKYLNEKTNNNNGNKKN